MSPAAELAALTLIQPPHLSQRRRHVVDLILEPAEAVFLTHLLFVCLNRSAAVFSMPFPAGEAKDARSLRLSLGNNSSPTLM